MVGARQRQDEFARLLQRLVHFNFLLLEVGRRYHRYNVQQDVRVFFE